MLLADFLFFSFLPYLDALSLCIAHPSINFH